ncbi:GIDE domain-containing protein [Actinomadura sp. 3N407]|uniref:GIDE domain-containing protein n=1 Tax=Actinomadura sp. 3N407 TaxID=3457423 RepID=UPI003FCEC7B7
MFYLFFGIIAAGFLVVGWVWRIRFRNLRRATVTNCAGVAALNGVPCQVTGTARAVHSAPFSGTPCAWYRVRATAKTKTGKRVFMDEKSKAPFYLQDETGQFTVHPEDAAVDAAVQTMDERRLANGDLPGLTSTAEEVKRYRYEEWILPPGEPLYILGTATGTSIGKDKETGQYSISTRTRRQFGRRALLFTAIGYGGGGIFLVFAAVAAILEAMEDD